MQDAPSRLECGVARASRGMGRLHAPPGTTGGKGRTALAGSTLTYITVPW